MDGADSEDRLRALEREFFGHERVCAERYTQIQADFRASEATRQAQSALAKEERQRDLGAVNTKLNLIMYGVGLLLAAVAAGDPLVMFLRRLFGHP